MIELNQANRGDLVRNPTRDKLATFIGHLNEPGHDPTSLWYFLSIHDNILYPLVHFLQWKQSNNDRTDGKRFLSDTTGTPTHGGVSVEGGGGGSPVKRPRLQA